MAQRNLDYAMRRYNQSWLLDPNNYRPYWGFGRVMLQRNRLDEGIAYLEKAEGLAEDEYEMPALVTDLGAAYSAKASSLPPAEASERARYFSLANGKFAESVELDQSYAGSWRSWAISLHREGRYADAWEKVREARARNARPFTPEFLEALERAMPEPR